MLKLLRNQTHAFPVDNFKQALESTLRQWVPDIAEGRRLVGPVTFDDLPKGRELVIFSARHGRSQLYSRKTHGRNASGSNPPMTVVKAVLESMTIPFVFPFRALRYSGEEIARAKATAGA